jgi:hypothetical protein
MNALLTILFNKLSKYYRYLLLLLNIITVFLIIISLNNNNDNVAKKDRQTEAEMDVIIRNSKDIENDILLHSKTSNHKPPLESNYRYFLSNEWIFNFNVSQYSSTIYNLKNQVIFRSFVLFDHSLLDLDVYQKEFLRCLILNPNNKYIVVEPEEVLKIRIDKEVKKIWRIKCSIPLSRLATKSLKNLRLAIVDYKEFKNHHSSFENSKSLLTFQQPTLIDRNLPKKKEIVHCLYFVSIQNRETLNRLINWIELQKSIGFKKIRIYLFKILKRYENELRSLNKKENFILEFVNYDINPNQLCLWIIEKVKKYPSSKIYNFLLKNCMNAYNEHFNLTFTQNLKQNHKDLHLNDCFMRFKYAYEYLTAYDFDELIFPRWAPRNEIFTSNNMKCETNMTNASNDLVNTPSSYLSNYNLYDYVNRIIEMYNVKNYSSIYFEPIIFFTENKIFLHNVSNYEIKKQIDMFSYGVKDDLINYQIVNKSNHVLLLNKFKFVRPLVQCLNKTYMKKSRFNYIWNNLYGVLNRKQLGKAIIITENTNAMGLHIPHSTLNDANLRFDVPLSTGYLGHFRTNIDKFFQDRLDQTFFDFTIDYEYYIFLLKLTESK